MRKGWIGIVVAAGMLAGCGGGGGQGAGTQESGQLASTPAYVAAAATAGDYYTWEYVTREQGTSTDLYRYGTKLIRSVAPDGAVSAAYLNDSIGSTSERIYTSNTSTADFDKLGRLLSSSNDTCTATPNPPYYVIAPNSVRIGMTWQSSGTVQIRCTHDPAAQRTFEFKDQVLPMELVTVPAGTFNALKVVRNASEEDGNFRQASEQTCWWEPDMGIDIKCVTNFTLTNKTTGESRSRVENESLFGYSNQKLARKANTETRFMGNWKGRFDGVVQGQNVSGTCKLVIDDGAIAGNCTGPNVAFNFTGGVTADGTLYFTGAYSGNPGLALTGKFDSLQQMSGSWDMPNAGSGSWVITQD